MKKAYLKKIFKGLGFFLFLSFLLVFFLGIFTVKNLSFIVSRLKMSLDSSESSAIALKFDIEGFKALNLIKERTQL